MTVAYLPPCESLFPLSDDLRGAKIRFVAGDDLCTDSAVIEVPRGFLGMNVLTERPGDPMEETQ